MSGSIERVYQLEIPIYSAPTLPLVLQSGTHTGPYEIVVPLGEGGMGEVYRARDTRLNREVALKVVSSAGLANPERDARFEREAQLLAALNHPHILILVQHWFEELKRLGPSK